MEGKFVQKKVNIWGGFDVAGITGESELFYPNIQHMENKTKIHFLVASQEEEIFIEIWNTREGT